jgi:hypothetical protein
MSERFVEAFLISPSKLAALHGTPALSHAAISKALAKKSIWSDIAMTFGDGDEDEGSPSVAEGLGALAAGKVPKVSYPERLTQLVLHAYGEPLKPVTMESNHMPASEDGFWNPAFKALGMKTIAKQWGQPNLAFPTKRAAKAGWGWPVFTVVELSALAQWKAELATPWRKKLATLPNSTFDPDADDDDEDAFMSRDEVEGGIAVLEKWVKTATKPVASKKLAVAKTGNALVLILDGDQ